MTRVLSGASDVDGNHVLPLREQAVVRDSWLTERLRTVLPVIMRGNNIDVWLVIAREYNEDPVLPSLLPAEWLSARRRTILALRCTESGIDARSLTKYPVAAFAPAWVDPEQSQYDTLAALLREWDPARIGVDLSETFGLADGLAHTEHELLGQALGDLAERLVSAEDVAIGWLETRLPEEIAVAHGLNRLAHNVIDEASPPTSSTSERQPPRMWPGGFASGSTTWESIRGSNRRWASNDVACRSSSRMTAAMTRSRPIRSSRTAICCTATSDCAASVCTPTPSAMPMCVIRVSPAHRRVYEPRYTSAIGCRT